MFKNASDNLNFIARTASHATKPSRTGRINDIPSWAREPEEYYNSIRDQYRSLADQLAKAQASLTDVNEKLKATLPFKEYDHLRQHKERLAARHSLLQQQAGHYRALARAAGANAWGVVLYHVAQRLLPPEDFLVIEKEVQDILGRERFEIAKGDGELSEQTRESRRAKKSVKYAEQAGANTMVAPPQYGQITSR